LFIQITFKYIYLILAFPLNLLFNTLYLLAIVDSLPIYNPLTRCHDLTLIDEDLTFAICLQRATNKQHPYNLYTSPSFCSVNYPPYGHLVDLISLSSLTIQRIFENLINLFNTKESHIDFPEPNFLWIGSSKIYYSYYYSKFVYRFYTEFNK
jgi:hypothetical protein